MNATRLCLTIQLLLCFAFSSRCDAFVSHDYNRRVVHRGTAVNTAFKRLPLRVVTEPERDLESSSDYFIQTEDYSILKQHHQRLDEHQQKQRAVDWYASEYTTTSYYDVPFFTLPDDFHLQIEEQLLLTASVNHTAAGASIVSHDVTSSSATAASSHVWPTQQYDLTYLRNLSLPQIHLPPRLVGDWQQHHDATVNLLNDQKRSVSNFIQRLLARQRPQLVSTTSQWKRLQKHAEHIKTLHLRDLLQDASRCDQLYAVYDDVYLDYSRQQVTVDTMKFLFDLAKQQDLQGRIASMCRGDEINFTEKRPVLHTALRADKSECIMVNGENVVEQVHEVLQQIKEFTDAVRSGQIRGYTGKRLRNIVSVGIGGSYLGPEFLHECLKTEPQGINAALGYNLRFLSNVDPVDVERTCADLDPEETLIVVVSKTFTTAETMLNARTMRQWLWDFMGNDKEVVRKHMVACASVSATDKVQDFGIDTDKYFFRFWDWVGGRYSVCSAAGAVPICLLYGFDLFEKFLAGAQSIDRHFQTAPLEKNIPVLMGLLGVWNMSFLKYASRTTLPYAEALLKLPAHIQQLDMESNGKYMTRHGLEVDYPVGEIDFGEAGTNGQHSFYQLLHMGQTVPCDFIGFIQSQHDFCVDGEKLSSHDELMANFFAQPDALANGKTTEECRAEGVAEELIPHRVFKGNRPSLSLLLPKLTAYACGQLLAIYEHRTAVQGFIWDINSFDQWGVELGKKLANDVKDHLLVARQTGDKVQAGNPATTRLLNYYVENSCNTCDQQHPQDSNPLTRVTRKTHHEHAASSPLPPVRNDLRGKVGKLP